MSASSSLSRSSSSVTTAASPTIARSSWPAFRRACEKRPISIDTIEALADRVELRLGEFGAAEVPSRSLGDIVMEELEQLDQVAWLRFASVYRSFQEVGEFLRAAERLRDGLPDTVPAADGEGG